MSVTTLPELLPLSLLGARETAPGILEFGIILPDINDRDGTQLLVRILHERDQMLQGVPPVDVAMSHTLHAIYGDFWSCKLDVRAHAAPAETSAWGYYGRYVYRYLLVRPGGEEIDWIIDPFAREFGVGDLSAITMGYEPYQWSKREDEWRTPALTDLVIYELMLAEFGNGVEGTIERLDYLRDLGINCIELMPVSNVAADVDWGYDPLGHFGVDERFGRRRDLQRLVDEAHQRGIAIVVDAVYGHTAGDFAYNYLYRKLGLASPFMGGEGAFGGKTDFSKKLTRDYFFTVNLHWLEVYHVDGFRYDAVPEYYADGYPALVERTYGTAKTNAAAGGYWRRFSAEDGRNRLIQIAEHLDDPRGVLFNTYSNGAWQNETLEAARHTAAANADALRALGLRLGLDGFPTAIQQGDDVVEKTAIQYIENHDHERFVCSFGLRIPPGEEGNILLWEGDREGNWFKVQPYLIGLFTAKGVPMLWEGQEILENYYVPSRGIGRIAIYRPVRWNYFYDTCGASTIHLVRSMIRLRNTNSQFRHGEHFFYNSAQYLDRGLLLFHRKDDRRFSLVALNFSDAPVRATFSFPHAGNYREELDGADALSNVGAGDKKQIRVPSNYGRIWTVDL